MTLARPVILMVATITVVATILLFRYTRALPEPSPITADAVYKNGRLWIPVDNDGTKTLALVDSGTSMSVFPDHWRAISATGDFETIASPFGQRRIPVYELDAIYIAGEWFRNKRVLVTEASYPLIGGNILFEGKNILFSQNGLKFDQHYDPASADACVQTLVNFQGSSVATAVEAVFFLMIIDGVEQKLFFDTGRRAALEATSLADKPARKPFPRPDIRSNSLGDWKLTPYYARHAEVTLGNDRLSLPYRHYYRDQSVPAPFVMGAEILKTYSILVDYRKGRACFFKN